MMNWDILTHTTSLKALKSIAKGKALIPNAKSKTQENALPFVYTHYHFGGLDTRTIRTWHYDGEIILCISKDALRDFPFSACTHMSFGKCNDPGPIITQPGQLSRKPVMTRLQNHINEYMLEQYKRRNHLRFGGTYYDNSHEVIFPKPIPTSYIVGAFVTDKDIQAAVQKYLPGIEIVYIGDIKIKKNLTNFYGCEIMPILKKLAHRVTGGASVARTAIGLRPHPTLMPNFVGHNIEELLKSY